MLSCGVRLAFIVALLLHVTQPAPALAQAWQPPERTGSISIYYKFFNIKHHTDVNGVKVDAGVVDSHVLSVDAEYGLTRRWTVNLSVPYSTARYKGLLPHVDEDHNLDDGRFHGGFQDFRFGLRYRLLDYYSTVAVAPFVEGIVPSHEYTTFAHAAIGRNLRELLVGTNIGWQPESFLPKASAQARISYAFVEKVLGRSHNRTNIDTQFTYGLSRHVGVHVLASFAKHHGGLDWDVRKGPPKDQWTPEELLHHDELTRSDMFDVGAGLSFPLGSTTAYATLIHTAWSRNAHPWNTGVIIGVNIPFRTRRSPELPSENPLTLPVPMPDRR